MKRIGSVMLGAICLLLPAVSRAQVDTAWARRYDGPSHGRDEAAAIVVDASGNVYVAGSSGSDYATIKYDSLGDTVWVRAYNGSGNESDVAAAVAIDNSGNAYVSGTSRGTIDQDHATIKYDPNGDTMWVRRFHYFEDHVYGLVLDGQNNVIVGGYTWDHETGYYHGYLTVKYDSAGNFAWSQFYRAPNWTWGYGLAVDDSGNIYITGDVSSGSGHANTLTIKYNANGVRQWVQTYAGPGSYDDEPRGIAVDESGSVYVTGWSGGDCMTIKYDSAGNEQWVQRYPGRGSAITIDGSGDICVTGYTGSGTATDYLTLKYHPSGGNVWTRTYNGPSDSADQASSIAIDVQGNVYVTGTSRGLGTGDDYATVKYTTAGVEQWVQRYDGSADSADVARSVALDEHSSVYVTGTSRGLGTSDDFATIKYVQAVAIEEGRSPLPARRHAPEVRPTVVRGVLRLAGSPSTSSRPSWLLDISGRKMLDLRPGANDVVALAPGVYFVRNVPWVGHGTPTLRKVIVVR